MRLGQLVGDVGAGVARADDEHGSVVDLAGPAVLARVQLQDARVEVRGDVGISGHRPNVPVPTTTLRQVNRPRSVVTT